MARKQTTGAAGTYRALRRVKTGKGLCQPGDTLPSGAITEADAARLVANGAIEAVETAAETEQKPEAVETPAETEQKPEAETQPEA